MNISELGPPTLMTIQQVAKVLGISVCELRRMVWAGEISYINLNKKGKYLKARFTPEHVEQYLRNNEVQASSGRRERHG